MSKKEHRVGCYMFFFSSSASFCPLLLQLCFHFPSCPPVSLVVSLCHNCAQNSCSLSVVVWRLAWWLLAASASSGDTSVEVSRNTAWCLVTFSILLQNYASVLTFSLMHKIHNVCGTSCGRCSRERGVVSQLRRRHTNILACGAYI